MGDHAINVHVVGPTDSIKTATSKFVDELKKHSTVVYAKIIHGGTEVIDTVKE